MRFVMPVLVSLLAFPAGLGGQEGWRTDFTRHTVPLEEIVSGGPPRDGIPAIDNPRFVSVRQADRWLARREPVAALTLGDRPVAYPFTVLRKRPVVNDEVGAVPIVVFWAPGTSSALDGRRFARGSGDGPTEGPRRPVARTAQSG